MLDNAYDKKSPTENPEPYNGGNADNEINTTSSVVRTVETPRFVAPSHGGVDILKLLTELEDLVENTPHGPMGMLFRFDEDKFHMTIMKIRANLPEEMKKASKLARDSDRILEEARESAERVVADARNAALIEMEKSKADSLNLRETLETERARMREEAMKEAQRIRAEANVEGEHIIQEARGQAAHIVADSEIVRMAQAQAQDMQARAAQEASELRSGAEGYARDLLLNLENVLSKAMTQVQHGRETLERG